MFISINNFSGKYETLLYYSQYYFAKFMLLSSSSNVFVLFIVFICLGFFTVFTPCFLSILPLSLSYISVRRNSLLDITSFICGLLTSFLSLVISFNTLNSYSFFGSLPIISNFFIILLSLDLMDIIDLSKIYFIANSFFDVFYNKNIVLQCYFTGLIIGFSSLPCNSSILFIINFLVKNINISFYLFFYFLAYSIGLILPLLLIFSFRLYSLNFQVFSSFWYLFNRFAGSFLFIISLLSFLKSTTS
uniref:Thiol:disulfide interchange protein n=1 Tax=Polysiphonia elongata TaxID=159753 RepID=A0A1Z1MAY2_9FLOR|nr:thiol:disulfide interchange protein [Polysiphonia elongata]ARW63247.1 thiol:disulfide interchange protein [Polysiphonia elongata]